MATDPRPSNGNLKKAHDKLEEIAAILRDADKNVQFIHSDSARHKAHRAIRGLGNSAERLSYAAKRLSLADEAIRRMAPAPPKSCRRLDTEKRTFHSFQQLPAELRWMIWEAAAQPPLCTHFFGTFKVSERGRQPVSYLMEDRGLWEACQESRWVVMRAYDRGCAQTKCSAPKKKIEMHYRRLGRFNKSGKRLYEKLCKFDRRFREQYRKICILLPVLDKLYELRPDTVTAESGQPRLTSEKLCKELRWTTLFTDK